MNELTVDGQAQSAMPGDLSGWRRMVFDRPTAVSVQCTDDSFRRYGSEIHAGTRTIVLSKNRDPQWKAELTFERVGEDDLVLNGIAHQQKLHVRLHRVALEKFVMRQPSFHWVQE